MTMDWQQIISLAIVALTGILLVRSFVRKRKRAALGVCEEDCGCSVNELVKNIPDDRLRQLKEQQRHASREGRRQG